MEQGFPTQQATGTPNNEATVRLDTSYIRRMPGILKLGEIVLDFLGFISLTCSGTYGDSRAHFFNFVATTGFIITGILFLCYLFHVNEKLHKIPWTKIEMYICGILTLLYIIAASLVAARGVEGYIVGAVFGFFAMICYAFNGYLNYTGTAA